MYSRGCFRIALQYSNFIIIRHAHARVYPRRNVCGQVVSTLQRLQAISRSYSNDDSSILEPDTFEDHTCEDHTFDFSFRKILYSEEDPMIKTLNTCYSTEEVLNILEKNVAHFQTSHLIQTIILLWDFYRNSETQSRTSQKNIQESSAFQILLERLASIQNLNSNESTCCYLYLKRLGLSSDQKLMQKLLLDNIDMIKKDDGVTLSVLSRFSVAVSSDKDVNTNIVCRNMMPHLLKSLKISTTSEEIRLITICLNNLRQLVSDEILDIYKNKVKELIGMGIINKESTKCLLRILNFLNQPVWSHRNSSLSRELMLLVLPTVDDLSENEVKAVFKIYQSQLEPSAIAPKLLNVSEKLLQKYPTLDMLACVVQFVEPKKRENLIDLFKTFLANDSMWKEPSAAFNFFTILRALKISDSTLCDDYWDKVLQSLKENPEGKEHYVFSRHSHRYMYFNNNLGGTYRHIGFEKYITKLCMNEITSGISGVVPSKFANIAPFVIGYGYTYRGNMMLPNIIVKKIESMESQFSIADCLQLSRGIQIALEMRFRHFMPETWASQLAAVEKALCTCTQRHLDSSNQTDANGLNAIVRALNNRKASRKSKTYQQALNKFNSVKSTELSSRLLRNMSFNLSASNFIAPQILETMFGYIVEHENYVNGDTAEKILSCSYNLGYCPQRIEGLYSSAKIVMRDFDYMTGLSIIQACLALSFYKTIPEELINKVFCVDFIKRVEEEIEVCYSKATYPERVLNQVMQLNRAVCLDFPEVDVPWFQQNYLEAQLSKYPVVKTKYSEEVKQSLLSVLKDESLFRCNHVTPYGYRIDFVIHFDNQNQAIPTPVETTVLDKITKVAILLLKLDSLCENDQGTLRGKEALRVRHLEMLGYKVVHINEADWNQLQVKDVKANYLKCLLQIRS